MIIQVGASRAIKFVKFLPKDSPVFERRTRLLFPGLNSKLLTPHVKFSLEMRRRDWHKIVGESLEIVFDDIPCLKSFEQMIEEVDSKTEGQILDETVAFLRRMHQEIRKRDLPEGFTLIGFLKSPPMVEDHSGEPNFDVYEVMHRTLGLLQNLKDLGKIRLTENKWRTFEQCFYEGYLFLRSAEILSKKV